MRLLAGVAGMVLLLCGCRAPTQAEDSAGGSAAVVRRRGYMLISTQAVTRTIQLQDAAIAPPALSRRNAGFEDPEEARLGRALSGLNRTSARPVSPPPARADDGLARESEDNAPPDEDPLGSWGWLNADVRQTEQMTAPGRAEAPPTDWLKIGDDREFSTDSAQDDLLNLDRLPEWDGLE